MHFAPKFTSDLLPLKMLIVLQRAPVTAPTETISSKEPITQVATADFIPEQLFPVHIRLAGFGLDKQCTILLPAHTGVVQRIDVNGHSPCVFRQFGTAFHHAVTVTRSVVGPHRTFVIVTIFRDGPDTFNGIFLLVELFEDSTQVVGNEVVTDNNPFLGTSLEVDVLHSQRIEPHAGRLCRRIREIRG